MVTPNYLLLVLILVVFVNEFSSSNFTNLTHVLGQMKDCENKETGGQGKNEDSIFYHGPFKTFDQDNLMPRIATDISENVEYADNTFHVTENIGFGMAMSPKSDWFNLNEGFADSYWDLNICSEANKRSKPVVAGVSRSPSDLKV